MRGGLAPQARHEGRASVPVTAFNYARPRATAARLIERYGQAGVIRRATRSGGNPKDPRTGTTTSADHAVRLVELDYDNSEVDGTVIRRTDRKMMVSTQGLTIEPTTSDQIVIAGKTFAIVGVKPLSPGGVALYFEIQARA
jgi:hypothetical protein